MAYLEGRSLQEKIADGPLEDRLTKDGAVIGTTAYMSPEQTMADPVDHRTDVWSLGVLIHELVTGERRLGVFAVTPSSIPSSTKNRRPSTSCAATFQLRSNESSPKLSPRVPMSATNKRARCSPTLSPSTRILNPEPSKPPR